ncbi:YraN family protein [Patescibacteria group bacterium]
MTKNPLSHKQKLGKAGEDLAVKYLSKNDYLVIERNFKARYGEIDIICKKNDVLIFVEVKARIGDQFGKPEESITPWKLKEVIKTSEFYISLHPEFTGSARIDVIGIELAADYTLKYFNHIENVTG